MYLQIYKNTYRFYLNQVYHNQQLYCIFQMTLKITIADAMLSHSTESMNLMKPYVILHTRDSEYKTRASSGRNPSWGDSVLITQREEDLTIDVFDMERGIDDTIGHAFVKVRSLIGQPYVPEQSNSHPTQKSSHQWELRLIVEYIQGKQHIGGLATFQSKLMMTGNPQPMSGMLTSQAMFPQQQGMLTSQQRQIPATQTSNLSTMFQTNQIPMDSAYPMGSTTNMMPQSQSSNIMEQGRFNGNMMMSARSQMMDPLQPVFNSSNISQQQPFRQMQPFPNNSVFGGNQIPGMMTSQPGLGPGNITIAGGTPSLINQAFGTRRMPIFKTGCPSLNWFSILDGQNKPTQCLPPRLI